jgi:hypothetical protein
MRDAFSRQREIFCLKRRTGFEGDDAALVAQKEGRGPPGANGAALLPGVFKIRKAEVFAVAAVLPLELKGRLGVAVKVQLP